MADELIKALLPLTLMGPPAPPQQESRQMIGRLEEPSKGSIKDMLPFVLAQTLDLLSTEMMLRRPDIVDPILGPQRSIEVNPLPGVKESSPARIGWGLVEALLAHEATKNHPELREKAVKTLIPGLHSALAMNNFANARGLDVSELMMKK